MTESKESMKFYYRQVRPGEAEGAARIEALSFPANEACPLRIMEQRAALASDLFYLAFREDTEEMVGFITAIASRAEKLRDEFFTDTSNHVPEGEYVMILSLAVLPDYRGLGLARGLMEALLRSQEGKGRRKAVLTCIPANIGLYAKLGYVDEGVSSSEWGGELWHEMTHAM